MIVSLGVQNKSKGYEILTDAIPDLAAQDWFVVAAGKVSQDQQTRSTVLSHHGMMSVNRFLDDDEIIAAYAAADSVWCLYDPSYDQASGILGRALQFGIPPLVRQGSLSEAFCQAEDIPHIAATGASDVRLALTTLPCASPEKGIALATRLRSDSIARLERALFGASDPGND